MIYLLINLAVVIIVLWLIFQYLIPMLPYPINVIVQIVAIIAVILWLLQLFAPGFTGLHYSRL